MRMPRKLVSLVTSASLALSLVPVPPSVAYADEAEYEVEAQEAVEGQQEEGVALEAGDEFAFDEAAGGGQDFVETGDAAETDPADESSDEGQQEVPEEASDPSMQDQAAADADAQQPADEEAVVAGPLDEDALDEMPDQTLEWVDDSVEGPLTASEDYDPMPTGNTYSYNPVRTDVPRTSYLHKNANGNVERVEYTDGKLLVETLSSDLKSVIGQRYIATSTFAPSNLVSDSNFRWGGFFSGSQYNFVATGQTNYDENNNLVVYRITKYTKDWSYVSYAELRGANTVAPFNAGTCFMAENGSTLHVRTCHTMYKSSDGLNHQANVHIVINESSMTITGSETGVMNQRQTYYGYVSHSFAQRVTNLNGTMYGLDLGDAYPRSVTIKKLGGYYGCLDVLPISGGTGDNYTGVTLGGFEASASKGNLLSTGASIDQSEIDSANYYTPRNAYLSVTSSNLSSNNVKYLTAFDSSGSMGASLPKLVKINDNRFLAIWTIVDYRNGSYRAAYQTGNIGYVFVDGNGNIEGDYGHGSAMLSQCDPIVYGNYAIWYAQNVNGSNEPMYYGIDLSSGEVKRVDLRPMSNVQKGAIATQTYTGQALTPNPVLSYNGKALVVDKDYTIQRYSDNVNAGTASITVEGINRYTGIATVTFTINPISVAIPKANTGFTYDGTTKTGVATGSNYSLSGTTTASGAGTYTATAQLKDTRNYRWSDGTASAKTLTWKIAPASIASAVVTAANQTYSGKALVPAPTVKLGSITLKADTDYTVAYKANTNVGTATVTVTGKGNYAGTASGTFKINRAKVTVPTAKTSLVYSGVEQVGVATGTGYKLSGTAKATKAGSYTATAALNDTANYQWADGTTANKSVSWSIAQADIASATASVDPQTFTGKALTPVPALLFNKKTLTSGTDFTLSYAKNVSIGTATITIAGKGNFKGTKSITFAINPKAISKATVDAIAAQTYNGKAFTPAPVVKDGSTTLKSGTDYTVAYSNNVNAGTATVAITGKGNYGGTKNVTFKINPANISSAKVTELGSYAYTGKAISPTPAVALGSLSLTKGTDYTIAYANNTKAGTATITLTGKGNYTGTKKATFGIVASIQMFRLYNPNSGEHFYTAKAGERDYLVTVGWNYEGTGWNAPEKSNTPVYRLYNKYAGDHHYTMSEGEKNSLVTVGWIYEGIGWYSDDAKTVPLYRQYNPYAISGSHNYTTNKAENDFLVSAGWLEEGIGWYGVK